ncbi:hypothetical protein THAOC_25616, partial [Thalassiosira oceanica]
FDHDATYIACITVEFAILGWPRRNRRLALASACAAAARPSRLCRAAPRPLAGRLDVLPPLPDLGRPGASLHSRRPHGRPRRGEIGPTYVEILCGNSKSFKRELPSGTVDISVNSESNNAAGVSTES